MFEQSHEDEGAQCASVTSHCPCRRCPCRPQADYCPSSITTVLAGLRLAAAEPGAFFNVSHCYNATECNSATRTDQAGHDAQVRTPRQWPGHVSPPPQPPPPPAVAAAFARSMDRVVLVLGGKLGGEGEDWNASLPLEQLALAKAVVEASDHVIVVLVLGNPMAMDWLKARPALCTARS